jgi:two-component system, NarL family, response regulator LiaR
MGKIRIVIADDHDVVREGTRALLERESDMQVVGEAGDGEEAIKLIEKLNPDVVILDISMPKLSGIEVTRQIKPRFPTIAVLILSAYDNDEYVFSSLEAGAAGYLLKDVHSREIVDAIRSVYSGESVLYPSIATKVIQRAITSTSKQIEPKTISELTDREIEVLRLASKGASNQYIADTLCISVRTVQGHINNIFRKLSADSRTEAIFQAVKKGLITFEDIDKSKE